MVSTGLNVIPHVCLQNARQVVTDARMTVVLPPWCATLTSARLAMKRSQPVHVSVSSRKALIIHLHACKYIQILVVHILTARRSELIWMKFYRGVQGGKRNS